MPENGISRKRLGHPLIPAALLLAFFGLAVGSCLHWSPTFDEGFYIARGWAFLKTRALLPLGHPPLTNVLSGLGVLLEPDLPDPATLDGWDEHDAETFSEDLLWKRGLDVERVTFLARLPIIWLGLLLGTVVWRWGGEVYGSQGAALALTLYALDPNVIAHSSLATTDLGVAAFYVTGVYVWARYLQHPSWRWLIISGVAFGLAQASKFSAVFLGLTLFLISAWHVIWHRKRVWVALWALIRMGLVGLVALWAAYLFAIRPYPLAAYASEFQHFLSLASEGHRAYALGRFSQIGWWWYHPFTLISKLPLVTLLLAVAAIALAFWHGIRRHEWEMAFPALLYLGLSMMISLNVGVRYLLPALPLIFVFSGRVMAETLPQAIKVGVGAGALAGLIGANLLIYPNAIAFFNLVVGGPDQGYRNLVDSNLDWGQDLPALADYLAENDIGQVYLSYFGQADPGYYGIRYQALPAWPPAPTDLRANFHPLNPAPGVYAISASNLVGVQLYDTESFGYFITRRPVAQVGHSIFIYEVPPHSEQPTWLAQCAVSSPDGGWIAEPVETEDRLVELTGMSGLKFFYFDCLQTIFDGGADIGWIMMPAYIEPIRNPDLYYFISRNSDGRPDYYAWRVFDIVPVPGLSDETLSGNLPKSIGGHVTLNGYQVGEVNDEYAVTLWWDVIEPPPPPVSFLVHLLRSDGSLLVTADGLGLAAEYWKPGMTIVQRHIFNIPSDTSSGEYLLVVGLYSLVTGERFAVEGGSDTIPLLTITLP